MREFRIRPVEEEAIRDYRGTQDAYYPTMHLMADLKEETGKEYEIVSTSTRVLARTDQYGIAVSPDSTDPVNVRRNYERTLPKEEQRRIKMARMFRLKV